MTFQVPPHVHFRAVHDEIVVLDAHADAYLGLNASAAVTWEVLASGGTRLMALERIVERFDVSAETAGRDIDDLVDDFVTRGLLTPIET